MEVSERKKIKELKSCKADCLELDRTYQPYQPYWNAKDESGACEVSSTYSTLLVPVISGLFRTFSKVFDGYFCKKWLTAKDRWVFLQKKSIAESSSYA